MFEVSSMLRIVLCSLCILQYVLAHLHHDHSLQIHLTNYAAPAALKNAVHPARPRREVQYVISELMHRLHHSNDWLVSVLP